MTESLPETVEQRQERYLRLSKEARERGEHASDAATREHYRKLATGWAALAEALESSLAQDALAKDIQPAKARS